MLKWFKPKTARLSVAYDHILGTSCEFHITGESHQVCQQAVDLALSKIDELEAIFSVFRPDSEFQRWQQTLEKPTEVSMDLAHVLRKAEHYRQISNNAFLPIADSVRDLWKANPEQPRLSGDEPLWTVDPNHPIATRHTDLPASLNAIAKGHIVDRAAEVAHGVSGILQVMVNIGGEIRHIGEGHVDVSVADPQRDAENADPLCRIRLSNEGMATSGGYRRGFTHQGQEWSHIFDPISGKPAPRETSASVIARTTLDADAIATILSVLPQEQGEFWASTLNNVGYFVVIAPGCSTSNDYWDQKILPPTP